MPEIHASPVPDVPRPSGPLAPGGDRRIDAAIDSLPMAPLPADFVARTMARVAGAAEISAEAAAARAAMAPATPVAMPPAAPVAIPGFRLRPLDLALPGFLVLLAGATLLVAAWSMGHADPLWSARLKLDAQVTWFSARSALVRTDWGLWLILGGLASALAVGLALLMERPWGSIGRGPLGTSRARAL